MKSFIKFSDDLPLIIKILLALLWGVYWGIYRIVKGIDTNNVVLIIIGILVFPFGFFFMIVDTISLILYKKLVWLA
ncbi:MAG: hypothetical protein A2Y45_09110 [Tenericutes bacterium GWC2_34_14]|nr:MAG: hypothetical protein A2Z84_02980 [Tenericutes bacterium GWA2_35_7]OHE30044.1 MAG: hypothetical protein A2Y45_09110 [Tenericutes bacterium GWC2_34_14]OHE35023.1 MAG: hypothetical protein A2012_02720 [Tenericutes bacterium GWE2_34_108]OHE37117.1 MAG: hypothetical protein A2Y46_00290 [Tenericutes bacterium GWF1_35_14]OHE39751.1 MAG: hypothetical protein A2Y44_02570 [Tenericutes bacterium GWF2_35_184]OHE43995.1 MAG: hypothetical protein A3K26_07280 [Tenericutes bacterium RIFOXYA12_FULL_35_